MHKTPNIYGSASERWINRIERRFGKDNLRIIADASLGLRESIPVLGVDAVAANGKIMPLLQGSAGFASYDELISETTAGKAIATLYSNTATTTPVAGQWYSMFPVAGVPAAGNFATGANNDFTRLAEVNGIYHAGNKSPETKHLTYAEAQATAGAPAPILMLVDFVGYYRTAAPLPTAQTSFTNTTAPNRYVAAGEGGLQIAVVNTIVGGATAFNLTRVEYTDQDGNAGALVPTTNTLTGVVSAAAPSATLGARHVIAQVGAGPFLPLAAGDNGARQIANYQSSGAQQASLAFCLMKPLLWIPLPAANVPAERDLVIQTAQLPRVYDGACLSWMHYFPAATGASIYGQLNMAWS